MFEIIGKPTFFKIKFLLKALVVFSVISIFYIKFLWHSYENPSQSTPKGLLEGSLRLETMTPNHQQQQQQLRSPFRRRILSLDYVEVSDAGNGSVAANCTRPSALDFPSDGLTRQERRHGWLVVHFLVALYSFWFLAIICDDYLVPAIEQMCCSFNVSSDIIGATVMAAAVSFSELCMNFIGTFVTKADIGIGTIVGSAVFNVLAVPAGCGLLAGSHLRLDWWPLTRDCFMYCLAVFALIGILLDGYIMWYEALGLVVGYFFYMIVLYNNDTVARKVRHLIMRHRRVKLCHEVDEFTPILRELRSLESYRTLDEGSNIGNDFADSPWHRRNRHLWDFILRWPLTLVLWLTIPDSRRHKSCKYLTFSLAVVWIVVISYLEALVITIIGDTLDIPDSIMGLTVLAAGMSVPEAVSSIIVTRQGQGSMGISNSIASNVFNISLSLGLPWFIKAYFLPDNWQEPWLTLNAKGLTYSIVFLLSTLLALYLAFVCNKFVLDWKVGMVCALMYLLYMVIAILMELNVFFPVNLPMCR